MSITLEDRVDRIWQYYIPRNSAGISIPTLQEVADVIKRWKRLFSQCYRSLDHASSVELSNALGKASRILGIKYSGAALQLLVDAWKKFGELQSISHEKIYRAGIAFYLSEVHSLLSDRGAAFWWQLHALADDYLEGGHGGGAKIVLETIIGISQGQLIEDLKIIADRHRENCNLTKWEQNHQAFAESVVVELAITHPEYASLFAYPTNVVEFPLCPAYLRILLECINNDKQGTQLEYLACYLFLHLPGCTPAHNLLDTNKAMQTDVIIRNLTPTSNLIAETLGRHFVIECKNWTLPVGSAECGYFLHRIHSMHCNFGVMLAKNGVTGTRKTISSTTTSNNPANIINVEKDRTDENAARRLIRDSYHEDGVTCIVLNHDDHLKKLADERTTLRAMLFDEIERFRFGRSLVVNGEPT